MKKILLNNIYLKTLKEIYTILDPAQRKKSFLMLFFIIINGLIDVLGLAFILPVLYLANNSSAIHTNIYLNYFYTLSGFENTDHFLLLLAGIMLLIGFWYLSAPSFNLGVLVFLFFPFDARGISLWILLIIGFLMGWGIHSLVRKLRSGEHRYISSSGKAVIYKPKNFSKWKQNKSFDKSTGTFLFEEEIRKGLLKPF
ncbi:MAG: hypothetical protein IIA45_12540, partial [Bacteroidetes bacterium]|nr:hypothetical protein [Bacteroidota bacterium]